MHLVVLGTDILKEALLSKANDSALKITWVTDVQQLTTCGGADIYLDLLFENAPERILVWQRIGKPVIINSVVHTLSGMDPSFVRFNGWAGFLPTEIVEASSTDEKSRPLAEQVFAYFGKRIVWVPDLAGFVTPRVVSAIINEAYFALEEGVSTKEEIDTAMKLGTNYPYGPFEWALLIGLDNVVSLLQTLGKEQARYQPAALLIREATL